MKEVYQTIIDPVHGNCMQAAFASLFNDELDNVPNFIELDNWFESMVEYAKSKGYKFDGILYNKDWENLLHPQDGVFEEESKHIEELSLSALVNEVGVDGLFYASVCSPKLFNWETKGGHAVVVDKNCNIVFDPNPNYKGVIRKYPFTNYIGYNGVIDVWIFNKIKEDEKN